MVCLIFFPKVNHASIIGTHEVTHNGQCYFFLYQGVEINVLFGSDDSGVGGVRLFDDFFFTLSDVGTSVTVTDADNPEFDEVVAILTNGVNDHLYFETHGYPYGCMHGNGGNEAYCFGNLSEANGIDFKGSIITGITLRLDALTLDVSSDLTGLSTDLTSLSTTYTIIIEGEIGIADNDGDTIYDDTDNCPNVSNPNQEDIDSDGIGDVCDPDTIYGTVSGDIQESVNLNIYILSCGVPQPHATVTTDAQGYYAIGDLPNGRYLVGPEEAGYTFSKSYWVDIPQTEIQSYDFTSAMNLCHAAFYDCMDYAREDYENCLMDIDNFYCISDYDYDVTLCKNDYEFCI
jgi:hypothetical protein